MKIYVPQKGDILTLEKNWYVELPSDLKKKILSRKRIYTQRNKINYNRISNIIS